MTDDLSSGLIVLFLGLLFIGIIDEPKSWKFFVGVFLLLGVTWLVGGGLFGFDTTKAAIGEVLLALFGIIFVLAFFALGILKQ